VQVSSWARATNAEKSTEVLDVAAHALQIYSKRFGDYPYDHFTVVQGPLSGGAGGAEFSGLAIIAQALYGDIDKELAAMFGPLGMDSSGPVGVLMKQQMDAVKSLLEISVAHETAHQWWAIGVGSDSRRDPWLDESLTNYCAMLYYKDRYGAEKYKQMVDTNLSESYQMSRMMGFADAKVGGSTDQFSGDLQYGAVVYGKGALFYQALNQLMGDDKFDNALQKYFSLYNGKMANDADLIQTFKNIDPTQSDKIEDLYQHWIWQLHGDADIGALSISDLLGAK
jgi:aminopeptidase N